MQLIGQGNKSKQGEEPDKSLKMSTVFFLFISLANTTPHLYASLLLHSLFLLGAWIEMLWTV